MFNFLKRFKGNNRFADKNLDNNIILTDDVQLSLDSAQTGKNLNVCVIGGTGMGKIYNYVLPNILQANTSYVITDSDGYLLNKTGKFLKESGLHYKSPEPKIRNIQIITIRLIMCVIKTKFVMKCLLQNMTIWNLTSLVTEKQQFLSMFQCHQFLAKACQMY